MAEHSDHHWIEDAIQRPGALTRAAKEAHQPLSQFEKEHHDSPRVDREVALAKRLKAMHHPKD